MDDLAFCSKAFACPPKAVLDVGNASTLQGNVNAFRAMSWLTVQAVSLVFLLLWEAITD